MTQVSLIDLHQLNVKQLQTIQISDTEYAGQPHVNEEQNHQNNNRNIRFLTK